MERMDPAICHEDAGHWNKMPWLQCVPLLFLDLVNANAVYQRLVETRPQQLHTMKEWVSKG